MAIESLNVVVLVGGVGGAKLAHGLAQILPPERLTVIVNTGDDLWYYGLRVCPDLDTVTYTLAGLVDPEKGWGIVGDTFGARDTLKRYGEDAWFGVGDKDFATHLLRTQALRNGERLTAITQKLTSALGIRHAILPMTDAVVATKISTVEHGELDFQDYFVRYRWQPRATQIRYDGAERATVSPEVERALARADVILFGPSNPWLSIAPILAVPGMRQCLTARQMPRVALSPIVDGQAIKGPAAKLMAELGYPVTAAAVAGYYERIIDGFVYDERDFGLKIEGLRAVTFDTIMRSNNDRAALAQKILEWILMWGDSNERLGNHTSQTAEPGKESPGGLAFPDERKQLSEIWFRRVLIAVTAAPQVAGALVISRDTHALSIARDMGAHTVQESGAPELNNALMRATQVVGGWRGGAVLILPADLPLVESEDVSTMIELGKEARTVVIATDQNEDGTNALMIRPPGVIPYAYGPGSFQRHIALAKEAGATVKVHHSERLALDIDVPADLEAYYRLNGRGHEIPLTPKI